MKEHRLFEVGLIGGVRPFDISEDSDVIVRGVTADSRSVGVGDLFFCMPSQSRDTHQYLPDVKRAGAAGAVVHSRAGMLYAQSLQLPVICVEGTFSRFNYAAGLMCREVLGEKVGKMEIVGITGTNGKTSTAWMVHHALEAAGRKSAYLGTLGFKSGDIWEESRNTTPFPIELWTTLKRARDMGVEAFVMEASSHALYERRLGGVPFSAGTFTNFTQDHLDFHGSMEEYEAAKKLLFTEYAGRLKGRFTAVLNEADPVGKKWAKELPWRVVTFGDSRSSVGFGAHSVGVDSISFGAMIGDERVDGRLPFGGGFQVENAAAAFSTLVSMDFTPEMTLEEAVRALEKVPPVPGRFEPVVNDKGIGVVVDYAHTPDGLRALLESARELTSGRIITVFGCGGDRDKSKRPLMGAAACAGSDRVVVTSDNPRTEKPMDIILDIREGIPEDFSMCEIEARPLAVNFAMKWAEPGDLVVIAGKGHENYQIIGKEKTHMDDRELAREALSRL